MNNQKNVLVCVSGLTSQIVSETFYCLTKQKKVSIDEIYILTTQRGRNVILGIDPHTATPKVALRNEIHNLCTKYKIKIPKFENNDTHIIVTKEESIELSDIRTDKHNKLFPNKVCDFIREKTSDPGNILYCSISGGRKTMSVHLAFALSLFGRGKDKLLHVLTSEENEFKGFYPLNKKEDKVLELAEIPYVRLRSIIAHQIEEKEIFSKQYSDVVELTQKQVKTITDIRHLILNVEKKEIKFGNSSVHLEPIEFAIYCVFVEKFLEEKNAYSINELITPEFGLRIAEFLKEHYHYYYFREDLKNPWWQKGFDKEYFRSKRAKINNKISQLSEDHDLISQFLIDSLKSYGQTLYLIKADKRKFKISY